MKRKMRKMVLCIGALLTAILVVEVSSSFKFLAPVCETAIAWVRNHSSDLPTTTADFLGYPAVYRAAIFTEVSEERRTKFYREGLRRLDGMFDLSVDQRARLEELIALITPSLYKYGDKDPSYVKVKEATDKLSILLPRAKRTEISPIWRTGDFKYSDAMSHFTPWFVDTRRRYLDKVASLMSVQAAPCNCYYNWDCAAGCNCILSGITCQERLNGCGSGGSQKCDGLCSTTCSG